MRAINDHKIFSYNVYNFTFFSLITREEDKSEFQKRVL